MRSNGRVRRWLTAAHWFKKPACGTNIARKPAPCVRKNRHTIIATSPIPICCQIRAKLPELPAARKNRFVSEHGLQPYDADLLTSRKDVADYFESAVKTHSNAKALSNWIVGDLFRVLKERKLDDQLYIEYWPIPARHLAELVHLIDQDTISGKIAKTVFEAMLDGNKSPQQIVDEKDLKQDSDQGSIEKAIEKVLTANTAQVTQYKSGNTKV